MNIKDISASKTVRGVVIGLAIAAIALLIFQLGVSIGYHKARFSERFADSFHRNFADPEQGFLGAAMAPGGHGAVGEVVSIALPSIVVAGPDNLEKTVVLTDATRIRQFQNELPAANLKVGDFVVVLGAPDAAGAIEAKLVRVMPPSPSAPTPQKQ